MENFTSAIQQKNTESLKTETLEDIAHKFPFFQLNKTLLLKRYYQQEHFKYNNTLKNVAAHTINREILFNYISNITEQETKQTENKITEEKVSENKSTETEITEENSIAKEEETIPIENFVDSISEDQILLEKKEFKETSDILHFSNNEKHSFNQWLQLTVSEPVKRDKPEIVKTISPKLNIINKFIHNNPKISAIKKNTPANNLSLPKTNSNISNELMTETLAKVYVAQKKFENAIQAYKILSLKYPEKSGLFADQIQRIKILQNHKS